MQLTSTGLLRNAFALYNKMNTALIKKIGLVFSFVCLFCNFASAVHIKGGLIRYEYISAGTTAGTSIYKITVTIYRSCSTNGPNPANLNIYDAVTYANAIPQITGTANQYTLENTPTKTTFDPCLSKIPNPPICYQVYSYSTTVTLTDNTNGYLVVVSDGNRVSSIRNLINSGSTGITFTATIPGILNGTDYHINASPIFDFKDTAIICFNAKFAYQFSATDKDGDALTYSFGIGLNGTASTVKPPYNSIPYTTGYTGLAPLGNDVTIDSLTGLITGTAPSLNGEYVIAVYVHEWRNGVLFNSSRKELQISVADCSLTVAELKTSYINCNNYTLSFQNESTASNITSYLWDFGVTNSNKDTSSNPTPNFTYADTGSYTITLVVANTGGCKDSASAPVKIYPGFTPSFTVAGSCFEFPLRFTDNSFAKYGSINKWSWDLGDITSTNDTSSIGNPSYLYPGPGTVTVVMNVNSSVGCSGSFTKIIPLKSKPAIYLPFTDTLICSIDTLPMTAKSSGTYEWTPNYRISNTTILNPLVYPKDTTVYTLTVRDQGCIDSVKVKVNVLQYIKVSLGLDTGICRTDSFMLRPVSDALSYQWHELINTNSLNSYSIKYPVAAPLTTTTYYVTANLGFCQDSTKIKINVSPYPVAQAGKDTVICFGSRIQLNGSITGSSFAWSQSNSLINTNTLTPIAGPVKTSIYLLTVTNPLGYCPKQVTDTVTVSVIPKLSLHAGKDTSVTIGQPLQLLVTGSSDPSYNYKWTPSLFLDNDTIQNPVATITSTTIDSIRYVAKLTTQQGCSITDDVMVHVYRNGPEIYVPTAFTPNNDGKNDVLSPVLVGISQFDFFNVYNRWGQLVFSTTERNMGWDGMSKGSAQPTSTYVYMAQGKDFAGKIVFRKGTSTLIR